MKPLTSGDSADRARASGGSVHATGVLPNFFIIGAMKAGTTSLWSALRAHPDVFMPATKELHYFSNPDRLEKGLPWYQGFFAAGAGKRAIGEASTNYTKHPRRTGCAARIRALVPDAKFIYVVREPVARIQSHYLHVVAGHGERRPIADAVHDDPEYLDICRYRTQLDQYLMHFPPSQLLVLTAEDMRMFPGATLERVATFLELDPAAPRSPQGGPDAHRSADKRVDGALARRIRDARGYTVVRRLTPAPLRRLAGRALRPPVMTATDVTVSDGLRREIYEELRPEIARLRPFLPRAWDGWGVA